MDNMSPCPKLRYRPSDLLDSCLDELHYPDMADRRAQVRPATAGTYEWNLRSDPPSVLQEHDVLHWLSSGEQSHQIYCIFGKPGSGKSTLMQFLDEQLTSAYLLPWAQGENIVRLQHYFWNPGSALQRSQMGMIQSLLYQMLSQEPRQDLMLSRPAQVSSLSVLANSIQKYMARTATSQACFSLIDGLDKLESDDITREDLVEFLIEIARFPNVKICLLCRPWDIFCDAFDAFPQLGLTKLTRGDIKVFVKAQPSSHPQFRRPARAHERVAGDFVRQLCKYTWGVMLWVHLVTRELVAGLRKVDGTKTLQRRLDSTPADLNDYFECMIDSIDSDLRCEASILLHSALHEEEDFDSVHTITLMDLSYTEGESSNFVIPSERHMEAATSAYRQSLNF
jgi:energy-coupling factor transporter ATP-binding protein EcfA2